MRGRKAAPIKGLDAFDFARMARTEGGPRERLRYLAFAHIQDGKSFSEAARMVKVTVRTVLGWVDKFRQHGIEGLREKPGRGAKPYIPPQKYEEFRKSVEDLQKGRPGGRIREKDIRDMIKRKYRLSPSRSTVYETLKRAGLVWITGRSQHPKTNQNVQIAFKKTSKKKS